VLVNTGVHKVYRETAMVLLTFSMHFMNSCISKHQRVTTMVLLTLSIHFYELLYLLTPESNQDGFANAFYAHSLVLVNPGIHEGHRER
jgi:hypothetical protein